jgi:hypothetical protein
MAFHVGYMGYCKITPSGGSATTIRITGSSLNPVQAINAPDLVQGEFNKRAWNYGPIETGGNISGPLGELSSVALAEDAWNRDKTGPGDRLENEVDVEIYFYKATGNSGRKFAGCQINSYALSVTAGDVATFTADFFGKQVTAIGASTFNATACEKLITWDMCEADCSAITGVTNLTNQIQGWSLTINNNLKRILRVGQTDLFPVDILAGIRDVTGSLTVYADDDNNALLTKLTTPPYFGADKFGDYAANAPVAITFNIGDPASANYISIPLNCYFARTEMNAQTDTMTYTANFTGLCNDYNTDITGS